MTRALRRKRARTSLLHFTEAASHEPPPARHHRLLIDRLEAVERGDVPRLMVFMPPGSAKSYYASVLFPAWFLGRNPHKNVIAGSYGQELADRFGRRVRGVVSDQPWQEVFRNRLSDESAAASRWALATGGEYYSVGIGGSITGFRADLGILDDPVKGADHADSEAVRARTWEWYRSDFWTRLKPGAAVILIMTRWHPDDLAGRLLADMAAGGERWEVIRLPMLAEPGDPLGRAEGEPLWPEWFTADMIATARRDSRTWSALYQQRPAPLDGTIFKAHWFARYAEPRWEEYTRVVQSWDTAVKADQLNDPSVCLTFGERRDGVDLLQVMVKRLEYPDLKRAVLAQAEAFHPAAILIEDKASGQQLLQDLRRSTPLPLIGIQPERDKITRAAACSAYVEAGRLALPQHSPWLTDFEMELMSFPNHAHDDQVDALSQYLNWLRGQSGLAQPSLRRL